MYTFDKCSLNNLLKRLLDARLKRLEKRNEDQLNDLKLEKTSYEKQGELINKLKLIKIKPSKHLFCITYNNSAQKKNPHHKIMNKTPDIVHNKQKMKNPIIKKKNDMTPTRTLKKNKTSNIVLPHYLSTTKATLLRQRNDSNRKNNVENIIQKSVQNIKKNSSKKKI